MSKAIKKLLTFNQLEALAKKSKTPLLIRCIYPIRSSSIRVRILYPDGLCEYILIGNSHGNENPFRKSCFVSDKKSLSKTLHGMKAYDDNVYLYEVVRI